MSRYKRRTPPPTENGAPRQIAEVVTVEQATHEYHKAMLAEGLKAKTWSMY